MCFVGVTQKSHIAQKLLRTADGVHFTKARAVRSQAMSTANCGE
jgi:hypothetical protein